MLVTQLCLILCNTVAFISPGSSVHGILRARILERVAIPSPGDLSNPGIEPVSSALQADSLLPEPPGKPIANNYRSSSSNLPRSFPYLFIADDVLRLCSVFSGWVEESPTLLEVKNAQILIFRSSVQFSCSVMSDSL